MQTSTLLIVMLDMDEPLPFGILQDLEVGLGEHGPVWGISSATACMPEVVAEAAPLPACVEAEDLEVELGEPPEVVAEAAPLVPALVVVVANSVHDMPPATVSPLQQAELASASAGQESHYTDFMQDMLLSLNRRQ